MGTIILVRHGLTQWNIDGRYQGQKDPDLSALGIEQANKLAAYLKSWELDAVYASDLKRASNTASIIALEHHLPVQIDKRLREFNFGVWEGLTRDQIKKQYRDIYLKRKTDIHTPIPGGETTSQVQKRVALWLNDATEPLNHVIVAVSHGGTIRVILALILGVDITRCYTIKLDNCGFSIIHWQRQNSKINYSIGTINSFYENRSVIR